MKILTKILEHKPFLLFGTVLIGGGNSVLFYEMYARLFDGPVPFILILFEVLLSFAAGLVCAEILWRINRWFDSLLK
jgi:hypothetical protein